MTKLREEDVMCAKRLVDGGKSVRAMARLLDVDESTLRYRLKRVREGARDGRRGQMEACAPYAAIVAAWMRAQEGRRRPEAIQRLYERLVSEHGYTGSYPSVRRYVNRRRSRPKLRPCRRVEVKPGMQAQIDWFEREVRLGSAGDWVRLYGFLLVLGFSRMWTVVWSRRQDLLSWIGCHVAALERIGGVPWTWRIDNLRTGVTRRAGPWATIHPGYASFARQVGAVMVDPTRVRTPRDKGKVERRVRDVSSYLGLEERIFGTLEELQAWTDARTLERSQELRHPTYGRPIAELWAVEREALLPLPRPLPSPFDTQVVRTVPVDGLVRFEGREYHVSFRWIGRDVEVRGGAGVVEIFGDRELLATYPRHTECRRLLRQAYYEGEATETVEAPVPLGRIGRQIVLEETWTAPARRIDTYAQLAAEAAR